MSNMLFVAGAFVVAILLGMMIIPNILLISYKKRLFDMPNFRKIHTSPVPRLGGVSFVPVILITLCLTMGLRYYFGFPLVNLPEGKTLFEFLFFAVGCILLYLVGIMDDLVGVGYRRKFAAQVAAALLLVFGGDRFDTLSGIFGIYLIPAWIGVPLTLLFIVYIINAINLIDGIDGLASGLTSISLVALSIMFVVRSEYIYAILALSTLGVLIPFWFYNVFGNELRGHKLFMGDAGSMTLGYVLAFLIIRLAKLRPGDPVTTETDLIVALSTLIVPMFDVVRVVINRVRKGRNPFLPDDNHFHHKLRRTGMRLRTILATILGVAAFFILLDILLVPRMEVTILLAVNIVLWCLMHLFINKIIRQHEAQTSPPESQPPAEQ